MPQRGIETAIWTHLDFCDLAPGDKLLFLYLVTSFRNNSTGMYRVTLRQIAFDTGLPESEVEPALRRLAPMDIEWFPSEQVVWVKHFLRHQNHNNAKFLVRVAEDLQSMERFPHLLRRYLQSPEAASIPYRCPIDALPISESESESVSETETVSEGGMGETAPDGAAHIEDSGEEDALPEMTPMEDELRQLTSWGRFTMDDRAWLESFSRDYPDTIPRDVRDMATYWAANAKKHSKGQWKSRLRNWARIARRGGDNGHRGLPGNRPSGSLGRLAAKHTE